MAKAKQGAANNDKVAEARKKAQAQIRAEQRRTTVLWIVAGVVLVGLFAGLIAFIVRQDSVGSINNPNQLTPGVATAEGGFVVGKNGIVGQDLDPNRVQVEVYVDFMCPVCKSFEMLNGPDLEAMLEEGLIDLTYHPIAILDHTSLGTAYSTRASSAAALIAEESPEHFVAFVTEMYNNQPSEYTRGLNDKQIQDIARSVGVPEETVAKIPDYAYAQWAQVATEQASIRGFNSTPNLVIDGVNHNPRANENAVNWSVPGAIRAAVEAAASAK